MDCIGLAIGGEGGIQTLGFKYAALLEFFEFVTALSP